MNAEQTRLIAARTEQVPWRAWGPYLSERQWGTVREDYSPTGDAWDYFTHDQARFRAYRWGEDGLAGVSDNHQRLCFALALWNGKDPILKERLYGLTNAEGNHGEDVKEYYFYLDATPTFSYARYLYKYPQGEFPYLDLLTTNRQRTREEFEYELLDTGAFADSRYFDVFVEYAKDGPSDLLIRITAHNRGPDEAELHLLPTLWFRNSWSWGDPGPKPNLRLGSGAWVLAHHPGLGKYVLVAEDADSFLFTENESRPVIAPGNPFPPGFYKDAFHRFVVDGELDAVAPFHSGTKAAALYRRTIPGGGSVTVRLRLTEAEVPAAKPFAAFDATFATRKSEADAFYAGVLAPNLTEDEQTISRQALSGMLWSQQHYRFDLDRWLTEHGTDPLDPLPTTVRNRDWFHMINDDVISMPDKWEYPWYAAWDLAFHCVALNMVDPDLAKKQLDLMLTEVYLHPNGQIPAYEWNFSDVNPPVHGLATWLLYTTERERTGQGDIEFLKHAFPKLMLNFTWWLNRKDRTGRNVFEGGFLGLDNIGVFDRSKPLPTGGYLEQADGTAWMALFSQNMLQIALELASHDPTYENLALKFLEHFLFIAAAITRQRTTQDSMWDEEDGFFYDLLRLPDSTAHRLKVRSMVGLLPLCATTVFPYELLRKFPSFAERAARRFSQMPDLRDAIQSISKPGVHERLCLALLDETKLRRVLTRLLDEEEFLSPHGVRSLSKVHAEHPYILNVHGEEYRVDYLPAESNTGMFGGNSNWRGPVWMPVNLLIVRGLLNFFLYHGTDFQVECPTGSGVMMNLFEVARDLTQRLASIFKRDAAGRRPVYGGTEVFQTDPHWRDHILFYEYFHGDNGAGLGASHQTGWTGAIAPLLAYFANQTAEGHLKRGVAIAGTAGRATP